MLPYLILAFMMGFCWLILFILRKDSRKKMLIMSLAVLAFAFFDYLSRPGYWHPPTFFSVPIGIEGVLFGFSFGGVASVIYPVEKNKRQVKHGIDIKNIAALSPVLIISVGLYLLFDVNMMISLPLGILAGCLLIMIIRRDLVKRLLYSGLYFGLLYPFVLGVWFMLFPQGLEWWNLEIYGGIAILNVPLGEVLFGFLFGAFWGVLYEFVFGYKLE
jgi:Lycopene cyclase